MKNDPMLHVAVRGIPGDCSIIYTGQGESRIILEIDISQISRLVWFGCGRVYGSPYTQTIGDLETKIPLYPFAISSSVPYIFCNLFIELVAMSIYMSHPHVIYFKASHWP